IIGCYDEDTTQPAEDGAACAGVSHATADTAHERMLMPRPTSYHQADLVHARASPDDDPRLGERDEVPVSRDESLERFVDRVEGIIDELLVAHRVTAELPLFACA